MPNIRDLRKRIRTVENIKRITSAMEKIAAARLFRAKAMLSDSRPYLEGLNRVVGDLLNSQPEAVHPLLASRAATAVGRDGDVVIVLVTSDRGFCGGFNSAIIEAGVRLADKVSKTGNRRAKFIVFGKKGADFLRKSHSEVLASYVSLPAVPPYSYAEEIGDRIMGLYGAGEIAEAHLVATEFTSVAKHTPTVKKVVPIQAPAAPDRNCMNFSYEPRAAETIGLILPRLVKTQIWLGLMESAVSEHAARMFMMQRATKNTDDVISSLTLVMNKARQQMITRELTDIVGAAETIT
jgi:F-type H+-transporting ATPase subunit gamma